MTARLATRRRLRVIVACWLAVHWSLAWAAIEAVREAAPDLIALPWAQAGLGVLLAIGAGLASTMMRYAAAKVADTQFNGRIEFPKDAGAAACVGVIGYYAGWSHGLAAPDLAAFLVFGGFGSARLLPLGVTLAERWAKRKFKTDPTQPGDLS